MATTGLDSRVIDAIVKEVTEGTSKVTKPVSNVLEVKVPEFEAAEGKAQYSKLFGKSFTGRDHNITKFDRAVWAEEMKAHIPTVNTAYVFQPEATEKLVIGLEQNDNILFTGPTGSGKSTRIEQVCALTNRPFIRINMSGDMESGAFFGQLTAKDGSTIWEDGPITEAVKYGGVCLVDEWELSPPEIMMGLQWLLEDNGKLYLKEMPGTSDDKLIIPHPEFRLVMAGNTLGQGDETGAHSGTNVQNTATLDRFHTVIKLDYLTKAHEKEVIKNAVPGLPVEIIDKMLQFAQLLRTAYKQGSVSLTFSPRTLINWGKKTVYWGDPIVALKMAYFDKIVDSEKVAVNNLVTKVFAKKVD